MVPSLDQTTSECYVWAHPGCPFRILLSLNVIEQLQAEVSQASPWRGEIGGLLIRSKRSKPGTIKIVDFIPLPGERSAGPHLKLPPESLAEAIARCPSDCKIAGYYRTDLDQSVRLRDEDLGTILQWFQDPACVFLVIAADDGGRSTAGFFFWENGSVASNSSLTFPFVASKLVAEGWPTQTDSPAKAKLGNLGEIFWKIGDVIRASSIPVKIGVISAILAAAIGIRVFTWNRSTHSTPVAPATFGLQVKREGTRFVVAWNPSAPALAKAKDASLVIWDSSREAWDGSKDPLYMPLTAGQLRSGSVVYTSFSYSEKVKFRLDATSASGQSASESMLSVSPRSVTDPASPPAVVSPGTAATESPAPAVTSAPAVPAVENLPRYEPRRSPAPVTLPRAERPAIPSGRPVRTVSKRFVPPAIRIVPHDSSMPEPPEIGGDVETHAPASFSAQFNPDAVAELGPPAVQPSAGSLGNRLFPGSNVAPPNGQSSEGVVTITSEPSGARVEINAVPAGVTPVSVQISPVGLGFTVTVTKNGYMKWTVQSFSTAHPYSLHAQLRQNPK